MCTFAFGIQSIFYAKQFLTFYKRFSEYHLLSSSTLSLTEGIQFSREISRTAVLPFFRVSGEKKLKYIYCLSQNKQDKKIHKNKE